MRYLNLSPFLVVLGLLEIIFLIGGTYYTFIENNGGMALAGAIFFIGFIINSFILLIEQFILHQFQQQRNMIFFIESFLLFVGFIYFYANGISIG